MKFIAEFVRILNFLPIFIAIFHKPYGDVLYCTARFFGLLFLVAELSCCPGCRSGPCWRWSATGSSVYLAFRDFGPVTGDCRHPRHSRIVGHRHRRLAAGQDLAAFLAQAGDPVVVDARHSGRGVAGRRRGVTLSRLSPMGKVEIGGRTYEAKSQGAYVDQQRDVEVVGFENFSVIVKTIK